MGDISTSDYTEFSGSDDTSDSQSEAPMLPCGPSHDPLRELVASLLSQGYHGPQIVSILEENHGTTISIATLNRRRKSWGLQHHQLPQGPPPAVQASIRSSHSKGLDLNEMQARLIKETQVEVSIRTIQRYLKQLNLKQINKDLQMGKVTIEKVVECIEHSRSQLLNESSGYRSMHRILKQFYSINIPQ
jgi:transposase